MTTYLVAGGCGFIGSNFVHYVRECDPTSRIAVVDNLSFAANPANLDGLGSAVELVVADICDVAMMRRLYDHFRPDYVVNFAAESHNDRAILDPGSFARTNALGAQALLEATRHFPPRRHLHVSTIEVYGELPEEQSFFTESSALNAKTPYSAAKAAGDLFVRAYMHTYRDLDLVLTHCANNYGPFQFPEKLIPLAITNVLRGRKVPVYGDGLQRRDWLHVRDHCSALWTLLHAPRTPYDPAAAVEPGKLPIYDISARDERTNLEIVHAVLRELGLEPADWIEHVPDRPNHDRRYLIDPTKLERELGWKPQVPFERGLADTVRWYRDHRSWWEAILDRTGDLQFDWSRASAPPAARR